MFMVRFDRTINMQCIIAAEDNRNACVNNRTHQKAAHTDTQIPYIIANATERWKRDISTVVLSQSVKDVRLITTQTDLLNVYTLYLPIAIQVLVGIKALNLC